MDRRNRRRALPDVESLEGRAVPAAAALGAVARQAEVASEALFVEGPRARRADAQNAPGATVREVGRQARARLEGAGGVRQGASQAADPFTRSIRVSIAQARQAARAAAALPRPIRFPNPEALARLGSPYGRGIQPGAMTGNTSGQTSGGALGGQTSTGLGGSTVGGAIGNGAGTNAGIAGTGNPGTGFGGTGTIGTGTGLTPSPASLSGTGGNIVAGPTGSLATGGPGEQNGGNNIGNSSGTVLGGTIAGTTGVGAAVPNGTAGATLGTTPFIGPLPFGSGIGGVGSTGTLGGLS